MTTTLRLNRLGQIGCHLHAPERRHPRWQAEGWRRMTELEWRTLRAQFMPVAPLCETCRHRPIQRRAA